MNEQEEDFWFPAKRNGWGWGFPVTWQGWMVFVSYIVLIIGGTQLMLPSRTTAFGALVAVLTIGLIAVCWLKGEKPRWRWGDE